MEDKLIVNRKGDSEDGFMVTTKISNCLYPNKFYKLDKSKFTEITDTEDKVELVIDEHPMSVIIKGDWCATKCEDEDESNILGKSCGLFIDVDKIIIPTQIATKETLAYYNARLIEHGETIMFESPTEIPQCYMSIGKSYVKDYIYGKKKGVYLEWHNTPHFHMPMNEESRGCLILGKQLSNDEYELSAFVIPYGYGVLMESFTIHNDLFLIGDYMVMYTLTDNYSTVVLKQKDTTELVMVDLD